MSFSIQLLPKDAVTPDGLRLGGIQIDNFVERFAVYPFLRPVEHMAARWKDELRTLVAGAEAVGLPTASNMTWVLYRFDQKVIVHEMLLLPGLTPKMSRAKRIIKIPAYKPDEAVSEWFTAVDAIREFLAK